MDFKQNIISIDEKILCWLKEWSLPLLRYSLGIVFIWFGILKPFGISSAQELVSQTVYFIPPDVFVPILGVWEVLIGISLMYNKLLRFGIALLMLQMAGTFLPLILLPDVSFITFPHVPSLEGQYIIKNLVLITGALVVASKELEPLSKN